jgi:hypothetical protein
MCLGARALPSLHVGVRRSFASLVIRDIADISGFSVAWLGIWDERRRGQFARLSYWIGCQEIGDGRFVLARVARRS